MGLLIGSIFAATLAGCNGNAPNPADTKPPSSTASLGTESSVLDKNGAAVLYIGNPDHLQEVSVQDAATAEDLIAALAKETGYDLSEEDFMLKAGQLSEEEPAVSSGGFNSIKIQYVNKSTNLSMPKIFLF